MFSYKIYAINGLELLIFAFHFKHMHDSLKESGRYKYFEKGEGVPLIILHGLMGGLSNFDGVAKHFPSLGYKVIIPQLPIYDFPLLKTNVREFAVYLRDFITHLGEEEVVLIGNSLGGHIGLLHTQLFPEKVKGLVITGSSGLYENAMGESYPKRENYEYIKRKTQEVFYDPAVATKEVVDDVFETVNQRKKLIKILTIAKSAIRHNMSKELPNITTPTGIIWGREDNVTPPNVGEEFHKLLPNSTLYWISKCGHAPMMEHPETFNQLLTNWLSDNKL